MLSLDQPYSSLSCASTIKPKLSYGREELPVNAQPSTSMMALISENPASVTPGWTFSSPAAPQTPHPNH